MSSIVSVSATAIRRAYFDDSIKNALLGPGGSSFGLPMSAIVTFKPSALEAGPVTIVPAMAERSIVPLSVMCVVNAAAPLVNDVSANFGWPLPPGAPAGEHDEPWLTATPVIGFGGEDNASLVLLPNASATAHARLWSECIVSRAFAVELAAPAARSGGGKHADTNPKREGMVPTALAEGEAEGEISVIVFYTML